jgi:hypothetical protein
MVARPNGEFCATAPLSAHAWPIQILSRFAARAERRELIERLLMRRPAASPSEAHKRTKELAV